MVALSTLQKLAKKHGTPLFVVDHAEIRKNYEWTALQTEWDLYVAQPVTALGDVSLGSNIVANVTGTGGTPASNFNNAINEMNKNKKNMLKNKLPLKDIREYEAQKYQIMKTFNDQVASAQKQR